MPISPHEVAATIISAYYERLSPLARGLAERLPGLATTTLAVLNMRHHQDGTVARFVTDGVTPEDEVLRHATRILVLFYAETLALSKYPSITADLLEFDPDYLLCHQFVSALSSVRRAEEYELFGKARKAFQTKLSRPFGRSRKGPRKIVQDQQEIREQYYAILGELTNPTDANRSAPCKSLVKRGEYFFGIVEKLEVSDNSASTDSASTDDELLKDTWSNMYKTHFITVSKTSPELSGFDKVLALNFSTTKIENGKPKPKDSNATGKLLLKKWDNIQDLLRRNQYKEAATEILMVKYESEENTIRTYRDIAFESITRSARDAGDPRDWDIVDEWISKPPFPKDSRGELVLTNTFHDNPLTRATGLDRETLENFTSDVWDRDR